MPALMHLDDDFFVTLGNSEEDRPVPRRGRSQPTRTSADLIRSFDGSLKTRNTCAFFNIFAGERRVFVVHPDEQLHASWFWDLGIGRFAHGENGVQFTNWLCSHGLVS